MQYHRSLYEFHLEKLVIQRVEELKEALSHCAATDVGQFRYLVGQIAGVREVAELMAEADRLTNSDQAS
jgi:hypothetical protein